MYCMVLCRLCGRQAAVSTHTVISRDGARALRRGVFVSCGVSYQPRRNYSSSPENDKKIRFEKENIMTIPNALSFSRIALSPVLGYLVIQQSYSLAFGVFALASFSDLVDGYIARRFKGQSSMLGSVLDPLADKCLVSVLCVTLSMVGLVPVPLTVLILGRDLMLVLASFYLRYTTLPPPFTWSRYWDIQRSTVQVTPTTLGKMSTFLQLLLVGVSLGAPMVHMEGHISLQVLWYLTGTATIGSGISYLYQMRGFKILSKKQPP